MPTPTVTIVPLDTLQPDPANVNLHTARGEGLLRDSIQTDGLIDGGTLAANDDMISGSSRLEQAQAVGLAEAIIVESDGTRPVYIRRTDIPTGQHPRAKRLGVAANRVAQTNLRWDGPALVALAEDGLLGGLFYDDELAALDEGVPTFDPVGVDEQGRLDQRNPVTCPECGHVFHPKA